MAVEQELAFASALEQAELIRSRTVSPVELVEVYLERIDRLNPELNCYLTVAYESARAAAEGAEVGLARRQPDLPPFHGVPIAIKDMADTAGIRTTWGSAGYRDRVPERDAYVVRKLKSAGFIVLGKTNTPEFASGSTDPVGYGPCRNPWNPERTVFGSSGGAGSALAAGLCPIAHGSDAGGSIRLPAGACGVVGLKPSRGRVSNELPGWDLLLQEGPLARTVADAAAMLDTIQGYAPGDPFWAPQLQRPFREEAGADPGRLRIGFMTDVKDGTPPGDGSVYARAAVPAQAEVQEAVRAVAEKLEGLGHSVAEEAPDWGGWELSPVLMWGYTAPWLAMEDELPPFSVLDPIQQKALEMIRKVSLKDYVKMMNAGQRRAREVVSFWNDHDILVLPTVAGPASRIEELRDAEGGPSRDLPIGPFCFFWNVTGQPAISLPLATFSDGMPLGVQLVAAPGAEATLIRVSAQLEAAMAGPRRRPAVS